MKVHIIKSNGDSILIDDVNIVHAGDYCSVAQRSETVQFWSDPIQHKTTQRIEIDWKK